MSKRSVLSLVVIGVISIFLLNFVFAEQVQDSVLQALNNNEKVPVIITYNNQLRAASAEGLNVQNWESKNVTKEELDELIASGNVARVEYDYPLKLALQTSRSIVNATNVAKLQYNGLNITGTNVGVCILDTGINYSHNDFGSCTTAQVTSGSCARIPLAYDFGSGDNDPYDHDGHGTHVAGIVGAYGGILGTGINLSLIIGKVFNDAGSGTETTLANGINWCVGNASNYNISVISMSINLEDGSGTILRNSFCDSEFTTLANAINAAYAKNISVVIAAGNDNSTGYLGAPSCIENATPIGSTNKSDSISSFSNRGSLLQLMAPGSSINSTAYTGGYTFLSGTSMATPHAAAIIGLLWQYLRASNQTKTPAQIESTLNNTGFRITDTTGINYSRINGYRAIISLDIQNPNVTLSSPANASSTNSNNQTFRCNATDLSLVNASLYVWNSTLGFVNQTNGSVSGSNLVFEVNMTGLNNTNYTWNCRFTDENGNAAFATSNFTFTNIGPSITLSSPSDGLRVKSNQSYVCNLSKDIGLLNVTFFLWNSTGGQVARLNKSITGTTNSTTFQANFSIEGNHSWNCFGFDFNNGSAFATANRTIFYDITAPNVSLISPANNSNMSSARLNVTLNEDGNCFYSLNAGVDNFTMSASDNRTFNATNNTLVNNANYTVNFYCNDTAGNSNLSLITRFTADTSSPVITLNGPANSASYTGSQTIIFSYNVSEDRTVSSCSLILDGSVVSTDGSIDLVSAQEFSQGVSSSATWLINCTDSAGNIGSSSSRSFTISSGSSSTSGGSSSSSSSSSSTSGGGGGNGDRTTGSQTVSTKGQTYSLPSEDLAKGTLQLLKEADKVTFSVAEEQHSLTIKDVASNYVKIVIASTPVEYTLELNKTVKVNLTSADKYDLAITLISISGGNALLKIEKLDETVPGNLIGNYSSGFYKWLIISIAILVVVFILAMIVAKRQGQLGRKVVYKNIKKKFTGK